MLIASISIEDACQLVVDNIQHRSFEDINSNTTWFSSDFSKTVETVEVKINGVYLKT